mmetsp:Transcript_11339/g.31816  ORF Transcript_11339/g.31816 Transcript_11339/m.31816 type:complete len:257 (+) Transcript_11339:1017-1787(+)
MFQHELFEFRVRCVFVNFDGFHGTVQPQLLQDRIVCNQNTHDPLLYIFIRIIVAVHIHHDIRRVRNHRFCILQKRNSVKPFLVWRTENVVGPVLPRHYAGLDGTSVGRLDHGLKLHEHFLRLSNVVHGPHRELHLRLRLHEFFQSLHLAGQPPQGTGLVHTLRLLSFTPWPADILVRREHVKLRSAHLLLIVENVETINTLLWWGERKVHGRKEVGKSQRVPYDVGAVPRGRGQKQERRILGKVIQRVVPIGLLRL